MNVRFKLLLRVQGAGTRQRRCVSLFRRRRGHRRCASAPFASSRARARVGHQADQHSRDRLRGFDARRRLLRARTLLGDRGEYLQTGRVRAERPRVPWPRLDRGRTEHIELLRIRPLRQRQPRQPSPTAERATLDRPSRSRRLCLLSLRLSTAEAEVLIVSCREVRSVKYRSIRRAAAL